MKLVTVAAVLALAGCDEVVGIETGLDPTAREPSRPAQPSAVVTEGVIQLVPDGGPPVEVVHVRVTIAATGDVPTTAHVSTATIAMPGAPTAWPIAANGSLRELPIVVVEPGDREPVDLYFPVAASASDDARYTFAWTLHTPTGPLALRESPALGVVDAAAPLGSGRYWWFSTTYAWPTARHEDGIITPKPPIWAEVRPTIAVLDDEPVSKECEDW